MQRSYPSTVVLENLTSPPLNATAPLAASPSTSPQEAHMPKGLKSHVLPTAVAKHPSRVWKLGSVLSYRSTVTRIPVLRQKHLTACVGRLSITLISIHWKTTQRGSLRLQASLLWNGRLLCHYRSTIPTR